LQKVGFIYKKTLEVASKITSLVSAANERYGGLQYVCVTMIFQSAVTRAFTSSDMAECQQSLVYLLIISSADDTLVLKIKNINLTVFSSLFPSRTYTLHVLSCDTFLTDSNDICLPLVTKLRNSAINLREREAKCSGLTPLTPNHSDLFVQFLGPL
jgi:hypothetical protein